MKKNLTKIALIAMSVVILALAIAVGTLAYLKDTTASVKNVFVVGAKIDINLTETTGDTYKVIPGAEIAKDPTITVLKGSEACYVFVKVETNLVQTTDATWSINSAWTAVPDVAGVYYIEQASLVESLTDVTYAVLTDNKITVSTNGIAEKDANDDDVADEVYMTFTGYAIQSDALTGLGAIPEDTGDNAAAIAAAKAANAKIAWTLLQGELNPTP